MSDKIIVYQKPTCSKCRATLSLLKESGEGVERTFQTYSPLIASIEIKRRGAVRRAKLYYLRERAGKAARIREKLSGRVDNKKMAPAEQQAPQEISTQP